MALHTCRNLLFSLFQKNTAYLHKPHCSSSIALFFSSSSGPELSKEPNPIVATYLINNHQFSPEVASKASSVVTHWKNPENLDSILLYLKDNGFSKTHLEEVIKRVPHLLCANLENTIKPKFKIFRDLGFTPTDISEIIVSDPWILTRSADNRVGPSLLALRSVLGSNANVCKILKLSGWLLKHNLEKSMIANIEFMKSCGISSSQLKSYMFNFPRFFLHKPENIRAFVKRVDEMGFDRKSKMFLHAIRAVSSMNLKTWEHKLNLFRSLGFTAEDILAAFRRVPQVFAISERKIRDVTQVLLSSGKHDISLVVNHPELLIYSIERRLKPRLRVLEILESKNLPYKRTRMTTMCKLSNKQFINRYVLPYSNELGDSTELLELYLGDKAL